MVAGNSDSEYTYVVTGYFERYIRFRPLNAAGQEGPSLEIITKTRGQHEWKTKKTKNKKTALEVALHIVRQGRSLN